MANVFRIKKALKLFEDGAYTLNMEHYFLEDKWTGETSCCLAGAACILFLEEHGIDFCESYFDTAKKYFQLTEEEARSLFLHFPIETTYDLDNLKSYIKEILNVKL